MVDLAAMCVKENFAACGAANLFNGQGDIAFCKNLAGYLNILRANAVSLAIGLCGLGQDIGTAKDLRHQVAGGAEYSTHGKSINHVVYRAFNESKALLVISVLFIVSRQDSMAHGAAIICGAVEADRYTGAEDGGDNGGLPGYKEFAWVQGY